MSISRRGSRFALSRGWGFVLALALLGASPIMAQSVPAELRLIQIVEPRSGPPGTEVRVYTENLPVQARIHVGVGATHDGFESLAEAEQGEWGEIEASILIPEFGSWDRPLVLIVFNGIFSPLGISDPFHVTNSAGLIRREGRIVGREGTCLTFEDGDKYIYGLLDTPERLEVGDWVVVEGAFEGRGACGPHDVLRVTATSP